MVALVFNTDSDGQLRVGVILQRDLSKVRLRVKCFTVVLIEVVMASGNHPVEGGVEVGQEGSGPNATFVGSLGLERGDVCLQCQRTPRPKLGGVKPRTFRSAGVLGGM